MEISALVKQWFTSDMVFSNTAENQLKTIPATTSDNVENIEKLILEDAYLKKKQLSALLGASDTDR